MRSGSAAQHERILKVFERFVASAHDAGLVRMRVEDEVLDGDCITIEGRRLTNFGSCAYSGLNTDPRLKRAAIAAVERFGPVFSSSTAYTSVDLYTTLERGLEEMFGGSVIVPTTTTLGHLSCLPLVVGPGSTVLIDIQSHASVHLATQVLASTGIEINAVPHNDVDALEQAIAEACERHDSVWYLADGVYSMLGDIAPVAAIARLLDQHPKLWVYIDDAHGVGWSGQHGRGVVLSKMDLHPRMIVAASLAKSLGAGGAVLVFHDPTLAARVQIAAGPMTFSGPLHPAELGAAVAAVEIMLSDEQTEMQRRIDEQIRLVARLGRELGLPFGAYAHTPIWFAQIGKHEDAVEVGRRMLDDGYFLNLASFPAVPLGQSGLRFTHTLFHDAAQIEAMLRALARHVQDVVGERVVDLTDEALLSPSSATDVDPEGPHVV
jgi:7-keto-8-aminopelargonate synthetase-like enzyme